MEGNLGVTIQVWMLTDLDLQWYKRSSFWAFPLKHPGAKRMPSFSMATPQVLDIRLFGKISLVEKGQVGNFVFANPLRKSGYA